MLNVALPKGRLGEKIYDIFEKAGYECPSIKEPNRKLVFENAEKGVRYFWVKPSICRLLCSDSLLPKSFVTPMYIVSCCCPVKI